MSRVTDAAVVRGDPEPPRSASNAGQMLDDAKHATDPDTQLIQQLEAVSAQTEVPTQGAILGLRARHVPSAWDHKDYLSRPAGAKIVLPFPSTGRTIEPGRDDFTVVGYFKSGMSEYDSTHVYVPIERLQFPGAWATARRRGLSTRSRSR